MPLFMAHYSYTDDTARRDDVRGVHREWLAGLDALVAGGPTDAGGAYLVVEAESAPDVERLLDADPFATRGGIIAAREVVGWSLVLGRWAGRD